MNNITKNSSIEDELDAIRIKLYEQTKDMTSEEEAEFYNKMAKEELERHGIKPRYAEAPPTQQRARL